MTGLLWLLLSTAVVLAAAYVPATLVLRLLRAERIVVLGLAPALGALAAGAGGIIAGGLGIRWSLLPWAVLWLVIAGAAWVLRRAGLGLGTWSAPPRGTLGSHAAPPDRRAPLLGSVPLAPLWIAAAALSAIVPIAIALGRPDAVLQRWDTLYHLSALRRIRDTGDGSSLTLGMLSNTEGRAVLYPAAFHDLAALVPGAPVPILLNGATAALAVVPWVLGISLLARVLWPEHRWGPFAAALAALLAPAAPLDEWIHLSPIPNLTGFAMLPGLLAAAVLLWRALLTRTGTAGRAPVRAWASTAGALGAGCAGLGLVQPNVAVMALLLLAVLTGATIPGRLRRRPLLLAVPVLLIAPVLLLAWTPLGAAVTHFSGGLVVPWTTAVVEVVANLLTVWPMALGVVIAVLWWPGLVASWRSSRRWVVLAWVLVAVLYLDAAVDSPLDLSILFYRGQDRLAMPLTMLSSVLVVPGLAAWARALGPERMRSRTVVAILVAAAVVAAGWSVPHRVSQARLNADLAETSRPRFLQEDELAAFERAAPRLDPDGTILASPFSGASHMYALHGLAVRFPVAGMSTTAEDRALIAAVPSAATEPAACRTLRDAGIRYVYQESRPYQYAPGFRKLELADESLGPIVLETDHSRLIEVRCRASAEQAPAGSS